MKRQIFFWAAVMCLAPVATTANGQTTDPFEKGIVDSVTIEHPIFAKVFPGVQFMKLTSTHSLPPEQRIYAYYEGKRLIGSINEIYAKVAGTARASIEERIEAYVRLHYWRRDPNPTLGKLEKIHIILDGTRYNYKIKATLRGVKPGTTTDEEMIIQVRNDQIASIEVFQAGIRIWLDTPKIIGFTDDRATIQVGGNIVSYGTWTWGQPPITRDHVYLAARENDEPSGWHGPSGPGLL